jgi:hypothetical protein
VAVATEARLKQPENNDFLANSQGYPRLLSLFTPIAYEGIVVESIIGQTFRNEDIVLDGTKTFYVNCKFVQCRFVYLGGDVPFVNSHLDKPNVTFTGEAAKVIAFMQTIGMMRPEAPPQPPPHLSQLPDSGPTN